MFDVVAIGDALIDFTPLNLEMAEAREDDSNDNRGLSFEVNVGGTSANFCACAAKLGLNAALVSRVGNDFLGEKIVRQISALSVDVSEVQFDEQHFTTLTFVNLSDGERSFSFSRKNGADIYLNYEDIDIEKVLNTKAIQVSRMSFTDEIIRESTIKVLEEASKRHILVTMDINYREPLWESASIFKNTMSKVLPYVDILKGCEEEMLLLADKDDYLDACGALIDMGVPTVVMSAGAKGAFFMNDRFKGYTNTYDTNRVDTTGAGDSFMAALVYSILSSCDQKMCDINKIDLHDFIDFANAAGACSITKRGGVNSAPALQDIKKCRDEARRLVIEW